MGNLLHRDTPLIVWATKQIQHRFFNFRAIAVSGFGTLKGLDRVLRMPLLQAALADSLVNRYFFSFRPWVFAGLTV